MHCNIIALGNSLRCFDFDSLEGFTIVLNNGYKYIDYDLNVWFDKPPYSGGKLETLTTWGGRWQPEGRPLRRDGKVSCINSSLVLAINIALNLGYKEIDVYGADGYVKDYVHFYDKEPTRYPKLINSQMKLITKMLNELEYLPDEKVNFIEV